MRPGVRRVRGCLIGNRGAHECAPGDPRGSPREPFRGSLGLTPPGLPYGTRVGDFCPGSRFGTSRIAAPCLEPHQAVAGSTPLLTPCRKRVVPGPPGSRAIPLSFRAPPVATRTVNGPTHVPSQTTVSAWCHSPGPPGISPHHGESRAAEVVIPELRASAISGTQGPRTPQRILPWVPARALRAWPG